jgi:hypothetical protein
MENKSFGQSRISDTAEYALLRGKQRTNLKGSSGEEEEEEEEQEEEKKKKETKEEKKE